VEVARHSDENAIDSLGKKGEDALSPATALGPIDEIGDLGAVVGAGSGDEACAAPWQLDAQGR